MSDLRPWISINFAISADGKISSVSGKASGWTSKADQERLIELRSRADALLVGRGTWESDRMTMRARGNPLRCVVSRRGRFDDQHPLFSAQGGEIHLLGTEAEPEPIEGVITHQSSLCAFLETLRGAHGVKRLHCEGGGQLVGELARHDWVDEIHLTWAGHRLFGGHEVPGIGGLPGEFFADSRAFALTHFEPREELGECFLSYQRKEII